MSLFAKSILMGKIRTFVAIPVEGLVNLERWARELQKQRVGGQIKWNPPARWHLTLKFIGDVDEYNLKLLRQSLRDCLQGFHAGEVFFEGSGYFGPAEAPRVLWAGVRADDYLKQLRERVEEAGFMLNLPRDDRPFRPHLTLGRIKHIRKPARLIDEVDKSRHQEWGILSVDQVLLYKSQLTSRGPVYSVVEQFDLQ